MAFEIKFSPPLIAWLIDQAAARGRAHYIVCYRESFSAPEFAIDYCTSYAERGCVRVGMEWLRQQFPTQWAVMRLTGANTLDVTAVDLEAHDQASYATRKAQ